MENSQKPLWLHEKALVHLPWDGVMFGKGLGLRLVKGQGKHLGFAKTFLNRCQFLRHAGVFRNKSHHITFQLHLRYL